MRSRIKFSSMFSNLLGRVGVLILAAGFVVGCVLLGLDLTGYSSLYMGLITYMAVPCILVLGAALALAGAVLAATQRRRGIEPTLPILDLNNPRTFRRFFFTLVVLVLFLLVSGLAGYHAYHFTESVEFCGELCHEVMKPEYVAYGESPHGHIKCAECHIGPGAEWFVKSKMSGLRQVYSVMFNEFCRPTGVPVESLRPAKETCSTCHWPRKSSDSLLRTWTYTLPDEENSPWTVRMLMNVGGGSGMHPVDDIHWHADEENVIDYASVNGERLSILWVRVTNPDGSQTIYRGENEEGLSDEELAALPVRRMDCMDCHNRPAHRFLSPNKALDIAIAEGRLDRQMPGIKVEAASLLVAEYETEAEALVAIKSALTETYPDHPSRDAAIAVVQDVFRKNFFPEMKVSWKSYPDHIGHKITAGCFRCHDGKHVSDSGAVIRNDCNLCHTIIAQGPGTAESLKDWTSEGLEFQHPEDIDGEWQTVRCDLCHTGEPM